MTTVKTNLHDEIALRAYFIWEREGCPNGRGAEHWALAEAEILSEQHSKQAAAKHAPEKKAAAKKPAAPKNPATKKAAEAKPVEPAKAAAKPKRAVKAKKPKA